MSENEKPRVAVVGSLNIDYVTRVDELPMPGQTIAADDLTTFRGGKGANQAIAALRQGCDVSLFGCVGDDECGKAYRSYLEEEGIDVSEVDTAPSPTGSAFIAVDGDGENTIIIAGGANDFTGADDIRKAAPVLGNCQIALCQFEVPLPAILETVKIANRQEFPVVINPSPVNPTFPWDAVESDYVIVNETEAEEILEFQPTIENESIVRQRIHELRIAHLIVTRGSNGTLVFCKDGRAYDIDTLPVLPIDTVGAGDAFAGCFAARIALGETVEDAVRAANCAGALTTLGGGAQNPMPDYDKIDLHIDQIPKISR